MPRLLPANEMPIGTHILINVLVAYIRFFISNIQGVQCLIQAKIRHHRRHNGIVGQLFPLLHIGTVNIKNSVSIDQISLFIHGQAAVCVAVKGKPNVHVILFYVLLQLFYMR